MISSVSTSCPRSERRSTWIERLPLLRPAQNRLVPLLVHRPAGAVEAAADRVEADDVGAQLGQRHAAERRGDVRRALDHAHALEDPVHAAPSLVVAWPLVSRSPRSRASRAPARASSSRRSAVTRIRRSTRPASRPVELVRRLDLDRGREHVALEHRPEVVAPAPGDDRRDRRQRPAQVRGRDRDRVPAVDQPPPVQAAAGVGVRLGDVERQPRQLRARRSPCRGPRPRRRVPASSVGEALSGHDRAQRLEVPAGRRAPRARARGRARPGSRRSGRRGRSRPAASRSGIIGQRQKSSTGSPRWLSVLIRSATRPVAGAVGTARVLLQRHDLGSRAQRVADEDRREQDQAAVEEVAEHPLGRPRRLADRDVADQVRVRERLARRRSPPG